MRNTILLAFLCCAFSLPAQEVVTGAEQMERYMPLLRDKQAGLVVNHSSLVGKTHLVDTLCWYGQCVARIFAPEHGFRGKEADGETIIDGQDAKTGIPIVSLYGKKKKPSAEDLAGLDVMVFDIQDVGTRFYTYISTLLYILEACAENNIPVMILDRPNPNAHYIDGPPLDMKFESFVGIAPLPIVHGCTVGELARLFSGECWMRNPDKLKLTVIPCLHYTHHTRYTLQVKPSPNLPDMRAILLYPSLCLFEGTVVSVGRGTDAPFKMVGHPDFPLDSFSFIPHPNEASRYPPLQNELCKGLDFRQFPMDSLWNQNQLNLEWLLYFYREMPEKEKFFLPNKYFDLLAGTDKLRLMIEAGKSAAEIRQSWQEDLVFFKKIRQEYLLYPD